MCYKHIGSWDHVLCITSTLIYKIPVCDMSTFTINFLHVLQAHPLISSHFPGGVMSARWGTLALWEAREPTPNTFGQCVSAPNSTPVFDFVGMWFCFPLCPRLYQYKQSKLTVVNELQVDLARVPLSRQVSEPLLHCFASNTYSVTQNVSLICSSLSLTYDITLLSPIRTRQAGAL